MSDYTELSGAGIKVIRAAFAAALSEQEEMSFAEKGGDINQSLSDNSFLSFLDFSPMGHPMGDELIPLAEMYSEPDESLDPTDDAAQITNFDIQLDDVKAHLHDKLLNISPDFDTTVSLTKDYPVLNRVYEEFLRYSEFAGKVSADSEEFIEAENFLFPKDDTGIPRQSDAYIKYVEYSDKCFELELKIAEANTSGASSVAAMLQQKLQRLEAEWITLGKKRQVEEALEILSSSDAKAGYEDERNDFIELLESRLRTRLGSSGNYAAVTISPLKPLLEPEDDGLWQKLVLRTEDVKRYLTPEVCELFGVDDAELSYVLEHFRTASMKYLRVFLTREWLSKNFLRARYWDNQDSMLSDGKGSGKLPTSIASVFFIKSAKLDMHQGVDVVDVSRSTTSDSKNKTVLVYNTVKTPLMKALIQSDNRGASATIKKHSINVKALDRLKSVKSLQSKEGVKLNRAKKLKLSSKLLHKTFNPIKANPKLTSHGGRAATLKSKLHVAKSIKSLRLNPGLIINRNKIKKATKQLNITGEIKHNNFISNHEVSLSIKLLDSQNNVLGTIEVPVTKNNTHLKFHTKVRNTQHIKRSSEQPARYAEILLLDSEGEELIGEKIQFSAKTKNISLNWEAEAGTIEMALSSNVTPTLFAYGLELLPKSPNPDESLFNS